MKQAEEAIAADLKANRPRRRLDAHDIGGLILAAIIVVGLLKAIF